MIEADVASGRAVQMANTADRPGFGPLSSYWLYYPDAGSPGRGEVTWWNSKAQLDGFIETVKSSELGGVFTWTSTSDAADWRVHKRLHAQLREASSTTTSTDTSISMINTNNACIEALVAACPKFTAKSGESVIQCDTCAGRHQQALRTANCTATEVQSWCVNTEHAPSPCSTTDSTCNGTCTCNFVQSPAEQSAQVVPLQCQFPEGNLFRYLNASTVSAVLDSSKLSPDTSHAWRMAFAVAAVRGGTVTVPAGNFVIASTVQLPKAVKIIGATQRGTGTPPTAFGSNILADFAGPVFSFSPPSSTSADILIQSLNIDGQKEKYNSSEGHGLAFSSCSNINLRDCVVANFAGNNVHFETGTGGDTYKIIARDVYSAQAGNANFYIGGEYSELHSCRTDGGKYGLFVDKQGFGLVVSDCHFEGSEVSTLAGLYE